ncbi:PREDICTED: pentatricopeptide repeat-containing protein At1g18485-like [Nicotiana attenuata]|uniref:pentatricopeptide repeat-containing protein At1g18485-like n=1 Tax=Nicotiana attenuata TaxID=49451 RepID=UPI0009057C6A|nr:PREDICTED: pentatricopeptide repeat-containing protein At1g18485-like [Nicotiana attenuata]
MHGHSLRNGIEYHESLTNAFIAAYAKCGLLRYAELVFCGVANKTISSWNALISGYAQSEDPSKALTLSSEMMGSGLLPDWFTVGSLLFACSHCVNVLPDKDLCLFRDMVSRRFQPEEISVISVLGACSALSAVRLGKEVDSFALKTHLMEDTFVHCSIINMYAKSGFMECPGNAKIGLRTTYVSILMACNHAGLIEGRQYVREMQVHGLKPELEHYSCVIDMLNRAGQFDDALNLMAEMPMQPDTQIWSSLLSSCMVHVQLNLGKKCAEKLLELEPKRAEIYVLVSNFFARYGDWDSVRQLRQR